MLRSQTIKTLWQMSPKRKLDLELSNETAQKIKELRNVQTKANEDGRSIDIQFAVITTLPFWQRHELFVSQSINRYLGTACKDRDISVSDIALEVRRLLGPEVGTEFPFHGKLRGIIAPYLAEEQVANVQLSGGGA